MKTDSAADAKPLKPEHLQWENNKIIQTADWKNYIAEGKKESEIYTAEYVAFLVYFFLYQKAAYSAVFFDSVSAGRICLTNHARKDMREAVCE